MFKARSLNLCTLGKITVVKSFVLGRIAYTGRTIPLTENADENLMTKICSFFNEGEQGLQMKQSLGQKNT